MLQLILFATLVLSPLSDAYLSKKEKKILLDAHNMYRRVAVKQQNAADMKLMRWDSRLEKFAEKHARKCKFKHSTNEERKNLGPWGPSGENLYKTTAATIVNTTEPVYLWYDEIKYYNYDRTYCQPGQMCGHYTQVVWGDSYLVGCAKILRKDCPKEGHSMLNCNYGPGGNVRTIKHTGEIVSHKIFKKGKPCSECTGEWKKYCVQGLCSDRKPSSGSAKMVVASEVLLGFCLLLTMHAWNRRS